MYSSISLTQVLAALTACGGGILFGLSFGWSSPAVPILLENGKFSFTISDAAWSVAMMSLGSTFSCVPSGILRNKFGTRLAIFLCAIPSVVGWLLLIFPFHSWMVILGRFLIGVTSGAYTFIVPVYIGEIASKEIRGTLLVIFDVNVKIGILVSYALPSLLSLKMANVIYLSVFMAYVLATVFIAESPVYLVKKSKIEHAKSSLRKLRAKNFDIETELYELQRQEQSCKSTFMKEMKNKATRKAFFIIFCIFVLFQATGDNALLFYLTTIFIESGVSLDPFLSTVILGFVQLLAVGVSIALIDRRGRKFLLILSFSIMCLGLLGLAVFFNAKLLNFNLESFQWVPVVCLCTFAIGFSAGIGSVPFVLVGELFSISAKRIVAPLAQTTNFFLSFIVTLTFPLVSEFIGMYILFYMFSFCCFIGIIYTWLVVPETKGKSLNEIQEILRK